MVAEVQMPKRIADTAADSQRLHAEEVLKAATARAAAEQAANDDDAETGCDPYNTADRKLPKNVPWAHLNRGD